MGGGRGEGVGDPRSLPASPTHAPLTGTSLSPASSPDVGAWGQGSGKNRGHLLGLGGELPSVSRAGGGYEHRGSDGCGGAGRRTDCGTVSPHLHQRSLGEQGWSAPETTGAELQDRPALPPSPAPSRKPSPHQGHWLSQAGPLRGEAPGRRMAPPGPARISHYTHLPRTCSSG